MPTKGRAARIATHKFFPTATIVVHSLEEARLYKENPTVDSKRIVVSGAKADAYGLTRQREWICRNLVKKNEWILFADDNVRYLIAVTDPHYAQPELEFDMTKEAGARWRPVFNNHCTAARFLDELAPEIVTYCTKIGAHIAGFAVTDNIHFRKKKFFDAGYVIGKLMLWHNTLEIPFDHTVTMEDFYHTAEHLKRYGACVVNNYIHPRSGHYQPGGMGTYDERVPFRRADVQVLLHRYPGLFRVKDREGFASGTDLQLCLHNRAEVEAWRALQRQRLF